MFNAPIAYLAAVPERTLDAPGIQDDFYTHGLAWSPLDILAVALDSEVYLWRKNIIGSVCVEDTVTCVSFSSSGIMVFGTDSGKIHLHDVETKAIFTLQKQRRVVCAQWNPLSPHLFATANGNMLLLWDNRVFKPTKSLKCSDNILNLGYAFDGDQIAAGVSHELFTWDLRNSKYATNQFHHSNKVRGLSWCPFQRNVIVSGADCIRIWDTFTHSLISNSEQKTQVTNVCFGADENIVSTDKNSLSQHDFPFLSLKWRSQSIHSKGIFHFAINPKKTHIATASGDETLKIWRICNDVVNKTVKPKRLRSISFAALCFPKPTPLNLPFKKQKTVIPPVILHHDRIR